MIFCENLIFIFFVQLAQRRYIRTLEPYMEEAEPEYLRLQQQFREILQCAAALGFDEASSISLACFGR